MKMDSLAHALAHTDQPRAALDAIAAEVQATLGATLFTLTRLDYERAVAYRCYSNMPVAYPVTGEKPIVPNRWTGIVLERHEVFVAQSITEISDVFPDHALIQSLGCESCVNIPIVIANRVIGTMNCLHDAEYYTDDRLQHVSHLKVLGALAFLLIAAY